MIRRSYTKIRQLAIRHMIADAEKRRNNRERFDDLARPRQSVWGVCAEDMANSGSRGRAERRLKWDVSEHNEH
jgi:hypothetical protein